MSGHRLSYDDEEMKKLIHFVEDIAEIREFYLILVIHEVQFLQITSKILTLLIRFSAF
jgi:hypothetical protein